MFKWLDRTFIKPVEDSKMPPGVFVLFAYGYIFIRNVLEGAFEFLGTLSMVHAPTTLVGLEDMFLHIPLFYFMIFGVATLLMHLTTGHDIRKISKVLLTYSFVILIPPIMDPLIRPGGYHLLYPLQFDLGIVLETVRNLLMPWKMIGKVGESSAIIYGSSPGMITEIYVGMILCVVYSALRGKTRGRKIAAVLLASPVIVAAAFAAVLPHVFIGLASKTGGQSIFLSGGLIYSRALKAALALMLPFLPVALVWLWLYSREKMKLVAHALDPVLLTLAGLAGPAGYLFAWLGLKGELTGVPRNPFDYLAIPGLVFMGVMVAGWMTAFRHSQDPARGDEERRGFRQASGALLIFSFASAWMLGYSPLYLAAMALFTGVLVAVPPIRLERFLVPASLAKALGVFLLLLAGYSVFTAERTLNVFPWQYYLAVFLPLWAVFVLYEFMARRRKAVEGKVRK